MPETPEQWLQRQINEGKARNSPAGRLYPRPHLPTRWPSGDSGNLMTDAKWRSTVTTRSNAEIVWPNLPRIGANKW